MGLLGVPQPCGWGHPRHPRFTEDRWGPPGVPQPCGWDWTPGIRPSCGRHQRGCVRRVQTGDTLPEPHSSLSLFFFSPSLLPLFLPLSFPPCPGAQRLYRPHASSSVAPSPQAPRFSPRGCWADSLHAPRVLLAAGHGHPDHAAGEGGQQATGHGVQLQAQQPLPRLPGAGSAAPAGARGQQGGVVGPHLQSCARPRLPGAWSRHPAPTCRAGRSRTPPGRRWAPRAPRRWRWVSPGT